MARYRILQPISYVHKGAAVHVTHPPQHAVELPDEVVAQLGNKIRNVDAPPKVVVPLVVAPEQVEPVMPEVAAEPAEPSAKPAKKSDKPEANGGD